MRLRIYFALLKYPTPCHVEGVAEESEGGHPAFGGENEHGDSSEVKNQLQRMKNVEPLLILGNSSSSTQLARASADNVLEYGQSENETSVVAKSSLFH